jgi:hypothetical protein
MTSINDLLSQRDSSGLSVFYSVVDISLMIG